jgi:hypothetical protein
MSFDPNRDDEYLSIVIDPLVTCQNYKPKFGHGAGLTLAEFQTLYQADPFYSWFGLDSPLLYAAHKAAGGMTSLYRQIGIGCQRLIQHILMDTLGLTAEQCSWSYQVTKSSGRKQTLSLDARIPVVSVQRARQRRAITHWLHTACKVTGVSKDVSHVIKGAVFEVRQGYKSKDSKRQNADIANAASAYSEGYLPVLLLLSTQIDDDVADRYRNSRWLILNGTMTGSATNSTCEFCRHVLGYNLADFFERNSSRLKQEIESILQTLLK